MQEYTSKIEHKVKCRKCKNTFLSVNGSPCPKCSAENKKLAEKREANKRAKAEGKEAVEEVEEAGDE